MAEDVARDWERMAADDPFWAVLTDPKRRGRLWERAADKAEFYASGEAEVTMILRRIGAAGLGSELQVDGSAALDVGCGVGRATRALMRRFHRVAAVDFSPSMLVTAREHALTPAPDGMPWVPTHWAPSWIRATAQFLPFAPRSFDLVYSMLVLQHQSSAVSQLVAVREILRVTKRYAAFQIPIRCHVNDRGQAPSRVTLPNGEATMLMTAVDAYQVEQAIDEAECVVVSREPDKMTGPAFDSLTYIVHRP